MKKLFFLLLMISPTLVKSQTPRLDTVLVRDLTMTAADYCLWESKLMIQKDSVSKKTERRIQAKIRQSIPANYNVNVTVDSLPGVAVIAFYSAVKNWPAGEIVSRYTAIVNAISSKANLAYWIGLIDGSKTELYNRAISEGKYGILDQ